MVGAVVHFTLGIGPQGLLQGLGAGLGFAAGLVLSDRGARGNAAQPGGFAVVLAVTPDDLVVFDQNLWGRRTVGVAGRVSLSDVDEIAVTERLGPTKVEFRLNDGRRWRYLVHRWSDVRGALPAPLVA